jgi:CubicO group peptidase (beta-lactamase class C family)
MQGGIGVSDNYPTGPSGWGVAIAQMYASTDLNWFLNNNRKMAQTPGTFAEYRSVDTQLLGMIIQKVTGQLVADYFTSNVWQPIGAEFDAYWNVDHQGGQEKTFCCFNAAARDYARVGQLLLENGGGVVSATWIKRLSTPVVTLDHNWGYSAFVWHPFPGISQAEGLHGQYIFMNPKTRTVIVKLSDNPTGLDETVATAKVLLGVSNKLN